MSKKVSKNYKMAMAMVAPDVVRKRQKRVKSRLAKLKKNYRNKLLNEHTVEVNKEPGDSGNTRPLNPNCDRDILRALQRGIEPVFIDYMDEILITIDEADDDLLTLMGDFYAIAGELIRGYNHGFDIAYLNYLCEDMQRIISEEAHELVQILIEVENLIIV